jgi:hypothetical protein
MVFIKISDPQTEEEGTRHRYTSFLLSTDKGNAVRRRYSDFLWLYKRLQTERPGAIIPVIPHSRAIIPSKKFDPEFIDERRRNLEVFLQGVVDHDELAKAPSVTPFMLDMLGTDFDEGKKKVEAKNPTSINASSAPINEDDYGTSNVDSAEKSTTGSTARKGIKNFFAKIRVSTGSKELMSTENENQVIALNEYITEVASYTKALAKAADALVKYTHDMANTYDELGVPIGEWRTSYQNQTNCVSLFLLAIDEFLFPHN